MNIRPPYRAPTVHCEGFAQEPHSVCFRHPAIPRAQGNLLLIHDGIDNAHGHLHHETARLACAIVAGNRWDGYLATTPTAEPIDIPPHGLLIDEDYYFIVPHPTTEPSVGCPASGSDHGGSTDPQPTVPSARPPYHYPVVPTFGEWIFPVGRLPGTWGNLAKRRTPGIAITSETTRSRDQCCRMTEAVEETDVSHVIPLAEEPWPGINDDANTMLLRADLHRSFDKRRFTFPPKREGIMVTHIFASESLRDIYHNVELNTTYIAPQYYLARFAWTILPSLRPFLRSGQPRLLLIQGEAQWASPAACSALADPPPKSRSASPTKKSRSPTKRSASQMEEGDFASQSSKDDLAPDDITFHSYLHQAKRARRGRSPTPRQNTNTQVPQSDRLLALPRPGDYLPSPEPVPSCPSRESQQNAEAKNNGAGAKENGQRVVLPGYLNANRPSDEPIYSTPVALKVRQL
ncbi:MAG: hypothetical protein Q9196_005448 [Gyalolechia fulgens]